MPSAASSLQIKECIVPMLQPTPKKHLRMTRVAISQPMYFAWPGFFEQLISVDHVIWLDDAQFTRGFHNRIQVKLPEGIKWLTLPLAKHHQDVSFIELAPSNTNWTSEHRAILLRSFKGRPFADLALNLFDEAARPDNVLETLINSAELVAERLGGPVPKFERSSKLGIGGRSWQRLLAIVQAVGGTTYVTGHGAANYLDHETFTANGIDVQYAEYSKTAWSQPGDEFTPYVSILDLVASTGTDARSFLKPKQIDWREFLKQRSEHRD